MVRPHRQLLSRGRCLSFSVHGGRSKLEVVLGCPSCRFQETLGRIFFLRRQLRQQRTTFLLSVCMVRPHRQLLSRGRCLSFSAHGGRSKLEVVFGCPSCRRHFTSPPLVKKSPGLFFPTRRVEKNSPGLFVAQCATLPTHPARGWLIPRCFRSQAPGISGLRSPFVRCIRCGGNRFRFLQISRGRLVSVCR